MNTLLIVSFFSILAMLLFSISFGLRFYESRRRSKLVSILRMVTEQGQAQQVNLLMDPDAKKDLVEALLGSLNVTARITATLAQSGMDWTLTKLAGISAGAFVAGAVAGMMAPLASSPAIRMVAGGCIAATLPLMLVKRKRKTRMAELETQLPDALDFLARSMRAGHAFSISLEMVGEEIHDPLGQEFRALFNEQNLGASLERSLGNFIERVPMPDVRFFSSAVLLQRQTGGNLSEILGRLSHIIRERFRLHGQVKAASAHGRLTATILTLLPLVTLGGLILSSPGYLDGMMADPAGQKILAMGAVAMMTGNMVIRKIIRIRV